jgi:hypothetical protein
VSAEEAFAVSVRNTKSDFFWGRFWSDCVMRYGPFSGVLWSVAPAVGALGMVSVRLSSEAKYGVASTPSDWIFLGALYVGILVAYVGALALSLLRGASQISRLPGSLEIQRYDFSANGIGVNWPQGANVVEWKAWARALETKSFIIIRHRSLNAELVFPKRDLSELDIRNLRVALRRHLGRRARLRTTELTQ